MVNYLFLLVFIPSLSFAQVSSNTSELRYLIDCTKSCDSEFPVYSSDAEKIKLGESHPQLEAAMKRHTQNISCRAICGEAVERRQVKAQCFESCRFDVSFKDNRIVKVRKKITEEEAKKCSLSCEHPDTDKAQLALCKQKLQAEEEKSSKGFNSLKRSVEKINNHEILEPSKNSGSIGK